MDVLADHQMTVLIYYDAVYNILQVYVLLECCCFSRLFYIYVCVCCVWLLLWQTTVFQDGFSLTCLTCFLYSFKDMDRFSLCLFLLFLYKHDISRAFFFLPHILFYCIARNGVVLLVLPVFFFSLCNFGNNHVCVCMFVTVSRILVSLPKRIEFSPSFFKIKCVFLPLLGYSFPRIEFCCFFFQSVCL